MKIQICGFSGSGKSTFAKRLSELLKLDLLYIDTIKFGSNWEEFSHEKVENDLLNFLQNHSSWVIDGNYFKDAPIRFEECDLLFIFKFNRFKCLYGAIRRYFKYKGKVRESIGSHLDEKIDWSFIKWILYESRKSPFIDPLLKYEKQYSKKVVVFTKRRQVNKYLRTHGYQGTLKYQ